MELSFAELQELLETYYHKFNTTEFIKDDPICIPHQFQQKEDIEIAGFLSATIAWGKRSIIINNGLKLMKLMNYQPFEYLLNLTLKDLKQLEGFVHRTFNCIDITFFLQSLRNIYIEHNGTEAVFNKGIQMHGNIFGAISYFREVFLSIPHQQRTEKHISNPVANSACKRINMFLRWMVRKDNMGVDFGIWNGIKPHQLICPLDVHTGNISRALGLLKRNNNDKQAAEELTDILKKFDKNDPVKYDFALFGIGIHKILL